MLNNLDIKKCAKINCGRQVKFLRNSILTTTFQENFEVQSVKSILAQTPFPIHLIHKQAARKSD